LDPASIDVLAAHRDRLTSPAPRTMSAVDGFVFTDDPTGQRPWLPNRVPNASSCIDAKPVSTRSGCTISAISWPLACSPPALHTPARSTMTPCSTALCRLEFHV
jgi:hypothetical protein